MGRKLVLTGTKLTDLSAPILPAVDLIMPSAGALLFIDPSHPYNPWPAFNLNNTVLSSVVLPNLAFTQAKAMIPAGDSATLGVRYLKAVDMANDGVNSKVERTGKGGLHTLFSQVTRETTISRFIRLLAGDAINTYVFANKSHSFYASFWGRTTRGAKTYLAGAPQHSRGNNANTFAGFYTRPGATGEVNYPVANPPRVGFSEEAAYLSVGRADTPIFQDIGLSTAAAVSSISIDPVYFASDQATDDGLRAASMIFYGYYLEDLTVSGRSYAQVNALVRAKYVRDVKTIGGRYYGDTFTNPTAMP